LAREVTGLWGRTKRVKKGETESVIVSEKGGNNSGGDREIKISSWRDAVAARGRKGTEGGGKAYALTGRGETAT